MRRTKPVEPNHAELDALYRKQSFGAWSEQPQNYSDAPEKGALGFAARFCVLATLPHSDPGDQEVFDRRNGAFVYRIQSGTYQDPQGQTHSLGLPYGTIPRVLLCWLTTEAVRTKEPFIKLGKHLKAFMIELGMAPTGGRCGSIPRLQEQLRRFFGASMSYAYRNKDGFLPGAVQVASDAKIRWDRANWGIPETPTRSFQTLFEPYSRRDGLLPSTITLGQAFFQEITTRPIPIDLRTVKKLQKSPLALDIYYWLTHRVSYLSSITTVPWEALQDQFGAQYKFMHHFKPNFLKRLKMVQEVYPDLHVLMDYERGMTMYRSRTHVPRTYGPPKPPVVEETWELEKPEALSWPPEEPPF